MATNEVLTAKQREQLATDIFNWLNKHEMWVDVHIYFNGKCWSTNNKNSTEFCYNENRYFEYEADPKDYFEYVREPNILSMSFEGGLYDVLNAYAYDWGRLSDEFRGIFEKYGVYFELGHSWNLSCYEI
jgi:hypothetical protein